MGWFGNNPEDEIQRAADLEGGRQRAAMAASHWNAATALFANRIMSQAPWLDTGTALAMAKGNASIDAVRTVARLQAARRAQLPNSPVGTPTSVNQLAPGDRRSFEDDREVEFRRDAMRAREHRITQIGGTAGLVTEFERDRATAQRHTGRDPIQRIWNQAYTAGLVQNGFLVAPSSLAKTDDPKNFAFRNIVRQLLNAGVSRVPIISAMEGGRAGFLEPLGSQTLREAERGGTVVNMGVPGAIWRPIPTEQPEEGGGFLQTAGQALAGPGGGIIEAASRVGLPGGPSNAQIAQGTMGLPGRVPVPDINRLGLPGGPTHGQIGESISEELSSRHLPTFGDIPGTRATGLGQASQRGTAGPTSIRETVQEAGMVGNLPIQEFTGQIRNAYAASNGRSVDWWEPQSDFLISATTGMEPGDGLLVDPDSEVGQERLRREEERGQINGQNITLGRIVAGGAARVGIIEPGDTAYRVLSGLVDMVPQVLDPTAVGLKGVDVGLGARTLFRVGEEAAEEGLTRPAVATSVLKSLASSFEVRGRSGMGRDDLVRTLAARESELADLPLTRLKGLASTFNVPGRSSMNREALVNAVTENWRNLGGTAAARTGPGEVAQATNIVSAFARGAMESTRILGVPQLMNRVGLINGNFTNGIHGPTAWAWLQSTRGSKVVKSLAEETSAYAIDRATGRRLTGAELGMLRDASTPAEVREVLAPLLGKRIRSTGEVLPNPGALSRGVGTDAMWSDPINGMISYSYANARAFEDVPGTSIDVDDPRSAINESIAWMRNAHMSEEAIASHFDKVINATNYDETFAAIEDIMQATDGVLAMNGVKAESTRRTLTKAFRREHVQTQNWFLSEATEQQGLVDEVDINGETFPTGSPHDWSAVANRFIYLPDYRAVRRLTSQAPNLAWTAEGKLRKPVSMALALQEDVWKPMTLLRGAWPVRVIGEEQLRMGASGLASMFVDPASFIAFAIARRKDLQGNPYAVAREYQGSQATRTQGWISETTGRVRTGRMVPIARNEADFEKAWANQLIEMHADEVLREIARRPNLDDVEDWLVNGAGKPIYERMLREHPERFGKPGYTVRDYLETGARWNEYYTGGSDDLLNVIRNGKIGLRDATTLDQLNPSSVLIHRLKTRYADQAPAQALRPVDFNDVQRGAFVDRAFAWLMAKPTNYLSRSQTFRQSYWNRVAELVQYADPKVKDAIIAQAEEATRLGWGPKFTGIDITEAPKDVLNRMRRTEARGRLTATEVDDYAKGWALDETKRLLYDLSKRTQVADSMRLVVPFAEAWGEVASRWLGPRHGLASPFRPQGLKNIRRFGQTIQGARGADLGEVLGAPEAINPDTGLWEQQGFFWRDEYGEEVFIYPGSQWLTGMATELTGAKTPVPLSGRVAGLSMFGEVIPGIGPVASIPSTFFLQESPGHLGNVEIAGRSLRDWALPYGHPSEEGGPTAIGNFINYAPPWMKRAVQAAIGHGYDQQTNRLYANSVMSTANYLYSTGKYDTTNEAGRSKLLEDAQRSARTLMGVRALVAFGAPSAPSPEFLTRTNNGLVMTAMLRDEYYRLIDSYGYEDADEIFLDRFGNQAGMVMQAQTRTIEHGIEPTEEFDDWVHQEGATIKRDFPAVWGFFGPSGGKFDYDTYVRQIRQGEREALTPEEWLNLGQNHLGQMIHDQMMEELGPSEDWSDADREWKAEMEALIYDEYPGFEDFKGTEQKASTEDVMRELAEAVTDPRILRTEAGEALSIYWEARQQVWDYATQELDLKTIGSKRLTEDREWLFSIGSQLADEFPAFQRLWTRQLAHEVEPAIGAENG